MTPFTRLTAVAAPLPIANIDTDMILPAAFLKTVSRRGLGAGLFHTARYDYDKNERPDFVLNQPPWRRAGILVTLENFGCGSSREHAPWALLDFGIRCILAPSFAEIFYNNCFKNGMLPIKLDRATIDHLMAAVSQPGTAELTIDLEANAITAAGISAPISFAVDELRRQRLLYGLDDIGNTLQHGAAIAAHEERVRRETPWLAQTGLEPWRG